MLLELADPIQPDVSRATTATEQRVSQTNPLRVQTQAGASAIKSSATVLDDEHAFTCPLVVPAPAPASVQEH